MISRKKALQLLVEFYQTGDLKKFDEYSIAWVKDTSSRLDVVNGFIETYDDPIGKKGTFESVVSMKDIEATRRIKAIADQAQWFEDNSPLMPELCRYLNYYCNCFCNNPFYHFLFMLRHNVANCLRTIGPGQRSL